MNGQELKRILQGMGIRQVDLAQKLGTTQQNLSYIFKAASVKTSRLEEIAAALGKDITMFFEAATLQAGQQISNKSHNKGGISAPSNNDYDGSQRKPPPQR